MKTDKWLQRLDVVVQNDLSLTHNEQISQCYDKMVHLYLNFLADASGLKL